IISYFMGQKFFKIKYDLKNIGIYFTLAIALYLLNTILDINKFYLQMIISSILIIVFIIFVVKKENLLSYLKRT
ncbi:MAG: lipopolysaccharide biosynthesis protein, partial [Bacteroidales bacterium]|nr:lipopolysaccharide biosynthesis protein [Bacteroidales bacterium]